MKRVACGRLVRADLTEHLETDYIDIYQIHRPDPLVPVEEAAAVMHQLYKQGKIRVIGVSNYSLEQMNVFQQAAPLHTVQPPYNLFERELEKDVLPYCRIRGISTTYLRCSMPGTVERQNESGH